MNSKSWEYNKPSINILSLLMFNSDMWWYVQIPVYKLVKDNIKHEVIY